MMRLMNNKKNVKIVSIIVGVLFVLSVAALAYTQMASGHQMGAQDIGYVNEEFLFSQNANSPITPVLTVLVEQAKTDVTNQFAAEMNKAKTDQEKAAVQQKMNKALSEKFQNLQKFIDEDMAKASENVREAKGLTMIVPKKEIIYGGVDVSEQVAKKLASDLQEHFKVNPKANASK